MSEVNWPSGLSVHSLFSVVHRTIHHDVVICNWPSMCYSAPVAITRPEGNQAMHDLTKLSHAELLALVPTLLAKLEEANEPRALTCKVSDKGAMSVYGFGQWPVTLYKSQWMRLFAARDQLATFLRDNDQLLKDKAPAK